MVVPGAMETDFTSGVVRDNPEMNSFIASQTALSRVGLPDDIAGALASLARVPLGLSLPQVSPLCAKKTDG